MAQVTLPNTITAGQPAEAAEVQENFEALRNGVNNIEREQIAQGEIHAGLLEDGAVVTAKIGTGAVTTDKLGSEAVTNPKIADGTIEAAKLSSNIQVLVHSDADVTIANGNTDIRDFVGLDTTIFPHVQVYWEDAVPNVWKVIDEDLYNNVDVDVQLAGAVWRVTIKNGDAASHDFKIVVSGPAA